jgi:UDP-N-acetylglucosamine 3-dehydrogenase
MPSVLLIGLGRWGQEHLRVLRTLGIEVFACDVRAECLEQAGALLPRDHLSPDRRSFLSKVDAVDVVTPAPEHFWICREALDAGKDVFVEKPITATLKEARDLCQRVATTDARLQVGHVFRFHPVYRALKRALAAGRLGRPRYLAGRFAGLKRPRADGGVTQSDAIHFLDLFTDLLGRPRAVTAAVRDFLGRGMDDFSLAIVEFEWELAVVESDYFVPGTWRELQVIGELGSCVADFSNWMLTFHAGHHRETAGEWQVESVPPAVEAVERDEPLRRELDAFIQGIGSREPPVVDAEAGYRALALVEAIHAASTLGRRVFMEEIEQ